MTTVTVRAPAKINLGLRVARSRDRDGYHPLATVYSSIGLYDEVKARPVVDGSLSLTVTGEGDDVVPLDATNLAVQAAVLLAKRFEVDEGVEVFIDPRHLMVFDAGGQAARGPMRAG